MIRRLRALLDQLRQLGDPFAVDTDWHDLDTDPGQPGLEAADTAWREANQ